MCTILTRHASINQIKSHWKTSEGEKQAYICCMFVEGKSKTVFFPSDTLIYGICRDGTKNNNIRACEHLILGQFRMGARSAIYAPLSPPHIYRQHFLPPHLIDQYGVSHALIHICLFKVNPENTNQQVHHENQMNQEHKVHHKYN